jgi:hypothetical protein
MTSPVPMKNAATRTSNARKADHVAALDGDRFLKRCKHAPAVLGDKGFPRISITNASITDDIMMCIALG